MRTSGRRLAIRRRRSTAASNARNRSVASSEPVGAGVVGTRVAKREAEPRQLAADLGHVLSEEVEGCVLDAHVEHGAERFKWHACLVAAPVEHSGRGRRRHGVGELGEQEWSCRSRPHHPQRRSGVRTPPPGPAECGAAPARWTRPTNATRCARLPGSGTSIAPRRRRLLILGVDTVPPGRHSTFDLDDFGRGLGAELFDQQRSVGLERTQRVGLAAGQSKSPDEQAPRPIAVGVVPDLALGNGDGISCPVGRDQLHRCSRPRRRHGSR